jgi:hypothetical protein
MRRFIYSQPVWGPGRRLPASTITATLCQRFAMEYLHPWKEARSAAVWTACNESVPAGWVRLLFHHAVR